MGNFQEEMQTADWTCSKCRLKLSKEKTFFEKEDIKPYIIIIGGTCEECSE